ncbi:galactokinase [Neiella marina]|uniref:Galactokinase n=1 Tax=Neiella marina TaxID=508461 RepID=A0A8J2XQR6_9GAMM|nr:galactokinase [Neiella marina]GGA86107.1 galactokinase [Neiella marina]
MTQQEKVTSGFEVAFGHQPDFIVRAPGRVNLIGEHTDYNDGFVLPCAIQYATLVAVSARADDKVVVSALDYDGQTDEFVLSEQIVPQENKLWANYVRGVVTELQKRGHQLKGCNLAITGNVPQGAGLSSSAALEVGIGYAFDQLCQLNIDKADIALIGQAAENNFVGCACGIMDQLISACGREQMAIGIDCRTLGLTEVSIPSGMTIMMINSNVKRGLVDSEYNTRRAQCEQAAAHFGVSHLRDVTVAVFEMKKDQLDPVVAKRAEHVVYENKRTVDAMKAFNKGDIVKISQLMAASHASMRDLFEITTKEIDYLVELIDGVLQDKGGVRMTGGGFGGCVVALVPEAMVDEISKLIEDNYQADTGLKETIYISGPMAGVDTLALEMA